MDWQEIEGLYKEDYNVESHTMNHNALSNMQANVLSAYYTNYSHDNYQTLQNFIKVVNSQEDNNKGGQINAIPIITYHNIVNGPAAYENPPITTDIGLFEQEMKYLHDNTFRVLSLKDIGYDQNTKF